jgi:single-strand DNA-binding protein
MNLNKVFVLGRVTADPQLRTTGSGQSVATTGIATNRTWTDKDGKKQEDVEFHNIVFWGRQAEIASQFLTKGSLVLVEGRLATRSWTDKNGNERKATEIICEGMQLGPKPQGEAKPAASTGKKAPVWILPAERAVEEVPTINLEEEEIKPEDIPF